MRKLGNGGMVDGSGSLGAEVCGGVEVGVDRLIAAGGCGEAIGKVDGVLRADRLAGTAVDAVVGVDPGNVGRGPPDSSVGLVILSPGGDAR
jgi:hypothetical protein